MKVAQNRLDDYFFYELDQQLKQIVTVHDEDIIKYPKYLLPQIGTIYPEICELMTDFNQIKIKLEVESDVTETNWAAAKEFKLEDWI